MIGGYVVRDPSLAGLVGRYLYADYYDGEVRSLARNLAAPDDRTTGLTLPTGQLGSFGEDSAGRLYVTDQDAGASGWWPAPAGDPAHLAGGRDLRPPHLRGLSAGGPPACSWWSRPAGCDW